MQIVGVTAFGGRESGRGKLFFRSIDETKIFQLKFFFSIQIVAPTCLSGLWPLDWA